MLSHLNVACFTDNLLLHQKQCLQPAVVSVWETKQSALLVQCRTVGTPLTIGGDGRANSLVHSAKYGSYGIIDLTTNKVIDKQLIQVCMWSNEVKSSNHMEQEGLAKVLNFLHASCLKVGTLITDWQQTN